ncbi:MAG TPA: tRNA pseudouridine(55) synthase TruB [Thermoleophilaceae bacterium]|nr:tRNA pseudouridine(55) synthase TruB [Thermoleophilaceae bacterium]
MSAREEGPVGVILYPKPAGVTSHDCVARVRRAQPRGTKVGHAGTLDPFATGLLLVLVGQMTRAQRWLMGLPKAYRTVAKLGWRSDTGDRDGTLEQTGSVPGDPRIATGDLMQRPPAYSAVRVGGERLYEKARRGEAIEGTARPVTVHRAERLWHEGDRAAFEIECSSGTYVRQLVADLGDAYCEELERTAIGPFSLADADPERIVTPNAALAFMPEHELDEREASVVIHGVRVPLGADAVKDEPSSADVPSGSSDTSAEAAVRLTHSGRLLAIAEPRGRELQPVVVFSP